MPQRINFPEEKKNYEGIQALLKTSRNGFSKPLSNNCRLVSRGENLAILLYFTEIITYTPDGKCILRAGRYTTPTTRRYMEGYAPVRVFSKDFEMFVTVGNETIALYDGLTIDLASHTIVKP